MALEQCQMIPEQQPCSALCILIHIGPANLFVNPLEKQKSHSPSQKSHEMRWQDSVLLCFLSVLLTTISVKSPLQTFAGCYFTLGHNYPGLVPFLCIIFALSDFADCRRCAKGKSVRKAMQFLSAMCLLHKTHPPLFFGVGAPKFRCSSNSKNK